MEQRPTELNLLSLVPVLCGDIHIHLRAILMSDFSSIARAKVGAPLSCYRLAAPGKGQIHWLTLQTSPALPKVDTNHCHDQHNATESFSIYLVCSQVWGPDNTSPSRQFIYHTCLLC